MLRSAARLHERAPMLRRKGVVLLIPLRLARTQGLHAPRTARPGGDAPRAARSLALAAVLLLMGRAAHADVELPRPDPAASITLSAGKAARWQQGQYEVWLVEGSVQIQQGTASGQADRGVFWIKRSGSFGQTENTVIVYLEENVRLVDQRQPGGFSMTERSWLGTLHSTGQVDVRMPAPEPEPLEKPAYFQRALERRDPYANRAIRRSQFQPADALAATGQPMGGRRLRAFPRTSVSVQAQWFPSPARNEWIAAITSGVNLIIDGVEDVGSIDISTDRMIIWTAGVQEPDLTGAAAQEANTPLEIYMEGNVVFRQGDRVIYADRMYYDVNNRIGTILGVEILTPVPEYQGLIRLKSDVVRQLGPDRYFAEDSYLTTSRLASPGYRLQAGDIYFEDVQRPAVEPLTGEPIIDPVTGQQAIAHDRLVTSKNNFIFLGPVPVFYWPVLAADAEDPRFYIRRASVSNDSIFGTQVRTDWDVYQLAGIRNPPPDTDWTVTGDYLSERGFGHGSTFTYGGNMLWDTPGQFNGLVDYWGIAEQGFDNLGVGRSALVPEEDYRYRFLQQHRHQLPGNFQLTTEIGLISDRNFLEQYFEREWDEFKDSTTGFELKQTIDNRAWSITGDVRVNDFFTETDRIQLDDYLLGEPLLGDTLTWYEHSTVGYAHLQPASTPLDPADAADFMLRPWEVDAEGERAITRQELDLPFDLGPFKFVPYALGEVGHWGEDVTGNDIQRGYVQAGLRASIPFWTANPNIRSQLFNVNGIAHKISFDADVYWAEASENLDNFPLYDQIDDNVQEHFRRRFQFNTFGGATPTQFEERYYAVRYGLSSNVTSPSFEIADDLQVARLGMRQRWQTKRGMPGQERIIDWIVLDTEFALFPDPDRDNFGEVFGLGMYDFRWHIGDRLTFLSDGAIDVFDDGQRVFNVGGILTRPPRGAAYLGFRSLDGPVENKVLIGSYSYRMSPKWISTAGMSYDFNGSGQIGHQFSLVRVGESLLVSMSFNFDAFKDNFGATFMVQPRFLTNSLNRLAGSVEVPPAGAFGLE